MTRRQGYMLLTIVGFVALFATTYLGLVPFLIGFVILMWVLCIGAMALVCLALITTTWNVETLRGDYYDD